MPVRYPFHDPVLRGVPLDPESLYKQQHPSSDPDYFGSIDQLRSWADHHIAQIAHLSVNIHKSADYSPVDGSDLESLAVTSVSSNKTPKLLVCHDFQGGYTECPWKRGYTFELWHLVDSFIYFSHYRVTIPPKGWIDAARRHGSKVFGTLIFEWAESKPDLEICLYGGAFGHTENTSPRGSGVNSPFSTSYASDLITLAQARKFDGYLLNIETDLNFLPPVSAYPGKTEEERNRDATSLEKEKILAGIGALISPEIQRRRIQRMEQNANVLLAWVGWLREEGKRRIGPHWEVIWYDSVTTAGRLEWQDALTPANAPFFTNSDAIFTNYTWAHPPDPAPPGALQASPRPEYEHHPALLLSAGIAESLSRPRADVYIGIDIFGRSCYGGFDVGRSLEMIFPECHSRTHLEKSGTSSLKQGETAPHDLGLSVALFAPGWTWEREKEDGGERTWDEWWADELKFWYGKAAADGEALESDDDVPPISHFFGPRERSLVTAPLPQGMRSERRQSSPADPSHQTYPGKPPAFYTNFNRGSGNSWWVRGRKVYDASLFCVDPTGKCGWTDVGLCFPKPDRIWPRAEVLHLHDDRKGGGAGDPDPGLSSVVSDGGWMVIGATLTDHTAWEGGTSLQITLRHRHHVVDNASFVAPAVPSRHMLPLCTLNACHFTSQQETFYSLRIVVKALVLPARISNLRQLPVLPCLLWNGRQPGGRASYHASQSQFDRAEVQELINGWYSITVLVKPDPIPTQTQAVPVIVLELGPLRSHSLQTRVEYSDIILLVGEIHFSVLSLARTPFLSHTTDPVSGFDSGIPSMDQAPEGLHWEPFPRPNDASLTSLWGVLTWHPRSLPHDSVELLSVYFNVFAYAPPLEMSLGDLGTGPDNTSHYWLGTSMFESKSNSFVVAGLEPSVTLHDENPPPSELSLDGEGTNILAQPSPNKRVYFGVQRVGSQDMSRGYEFEVGVECR